MPSNEIMPYDSLFTFDTIRTLGGASFLCYLIVAYTKDIIDKWFSSWLPTNVYSLFVATVILILIQLNDNPGSLFEWQTYFLAAANGFLVSATASHTHELGTRFPKLGKKNGHKKKDQKPQNSNENVNSDEKSEEVREG